MKIALFHPWIKSKGGAEKVVLEFLNNTQHDVDVYTWSYDKKNTFEEFKKYNIIVLSSSGLGGLSRNYMARGFFWLLAFSSRIPLKNYDCFLISTGGLAEVITLRNYKKGKTFAYVHTILRAANKEDIRWNLKYRFKNPLMKGVYLILVGFYRILEKISWTKINVAIFNSQLSLDRARSHGLLKNKKVFIVNPGADIKQNKISKKTDQSVLYVARFGASKRQDVLINAWKRFVQEYPGYKLIMIGNPENKKYFDFLAEQAGKIKNIQLKPNVSEREKEELYKNCDAGIFVPFMEDFGIVRLRSRRSMPAPPGTGRQGVRE